MLLYLRQRGNKMKKFFKIIGGILGVIVILAAIFLGVMTAWEYRPAAVEALEVPEAVIGDVSQ